MAVKSPNPLWARLGSGWRSRREKVRHVLRNGWNRAVLLIYRLPLNQQTVLAGAAVGMVSGLAAFALERAIHWISAAGLHRLHALSDPLRVAGTLTLPALGGLGAGILIHRFASEARGHGIHAVLEALEQRGGRIRARVGWVKLLATASTLGSGGSAGREGPILQIGAAAGSWLGHVFRVREQALKTLVAAGCVGGLSAAFSIPLAGVFFTMEVIVRNFANRAFPAVVVASVSGAVTARVLMGAEAFFTPLTYEWRHPVELLFFAAVGLACVPAASWYRLTLSGAEKAFARLPAPDWLKPALGGLLVGALALAMPEVMGAGVDVVNRILSGENLGWFLLVLAAGKTLATGFTLGSGGSGGTMMPALFVGAMLGAGMGEALGWIGADAAVPGLAAVGMAAMFAAVFHAPVTAMIMAFELTRDYGILVPAMLACALSHLFSRPARERPPATFKPGPDLPKN